MEPLSYIVLTVLFKNGMEGGKGDRNIERGIFLYRMNIKGENIKLMYLKQ